VTRRPLSSYARLILRPPKRFITLGAAPLLAGLLMVDLLRSWRHLFSAVLALSTDGGPIDHRLREAYTGSLQKISPNPDLPPHLRGDFAKLMEELTDLLSEHSQVDTKRASAVAKKVVVLYDRVTKEL
jgi:hypothetical protein